MRVVVNLKDFKSQLEDVAKAIKPKANTFYEYVFIDVDDWGRYKMAATHCREYFTFEASGKFIESDTPGTFAIPAKKVLECLKCKKDNLLTLESSEVNHTLKITIGELVFNLGSIDPEAYEFIQDIEPTTSISLACSPFIDLIETVSYATSNEPTKQVLCGIVLSCSNGEISAGATDGHRLVMASLPGVYPVEDFEFVIPKIPLTKAIANLKKLQSEKLVLHFLDQSLHGDGGFLQIETKGFKASMTLTPGQYPNLSQLIPRQFNYEIDLDRQQVLTHLNMMDTLMVQFIINPGDTPSQLIPMDSDGSHPELAATITIAPIKLAEGFTVRFQLKYVKETLQNHKTKLVRMRVNTGKSPVIFGEHSSLIMPVQTRN